jgi:ADP-ribose pyrophosphatase
MTERWRVSQYRHAAGKYLLRDPAGSLNNGEDPETGAIRELEEEIGVKAGKIERLIRVLRLPGFLTERCAHVFLATGLTQVGQKTEEDEFNRAERLTFPAAFDPYKKGEIEDAKHYCGLTLAGQTGYPIQAAFAP